MRVTNSLAKLPIKLQSIFTNYNIFDTRKYNIFAKKFAVLLPKGDPVEFKNLVYQ